MGLVILNGLTGIKVYDDDKNTSYENLDCTEDTLSAPTGVPDDEATVVLLKVKITDSVTNEQMSVKGPNVTVAPRGSTILLNGQNKISYIRALTTAAGVVSWRVAGLTRATEVWVVGYVEMNESGENDLQFSSTDVTGTEYFTAEDSNTDAQPDALFFYNCYLDNNWGTPTSSYLGLLPKNIDWGNHDIGNAGVGIAYLSNTGTAHYLGTLSAMSKTATAHIGVEWEFNGSGEATASEVRLYMQAWTNDQVTAHDTEVFDDTLTTADTKEELDLSGELGPGYHYVQLRVRGGSGQVRVSVVPYGDDGDIDAGEIDYGPTRAWVGWSNVGTIETWTNADGKVAIAANNNTVTVTVDLLGSISAVVAPTVTSQAASSILVTSATGNGNVTDDGGESPSQHGVCWKAGSDPVDIAGSDDYSEEGAGSEGAFTSTIDGLIELTTYYYRAYATNSKGTSYGAAQSFTTKLRPRIM